MTQSIPPLAIKKGVSPNTIWLPNGNWQTVFDYFIDKFPHLSISDCEKRFNAKEVVFSDGETITLKTPYQSERHLYFYRELETELIVPFEEAILYEDENILLADKPHFLPVAPTGQYLHETLLVRLRNKTGIDSLELAHRLDRETAGIVLLTKKQSVRAAYHTLFSERKIVKVYHAIANQKALDFPLYHTAKMVKGEPYFRMKEVEGEVNSETLIECLSSKNNQSLYRLTPKTGKKHQLRVHMMALGIPIKNDPIYPQLTDKPSQNLSNPLQLLAKSLQFIDPFSGHKCYFESQFNLQI